MMSDLYISGRLTRLTFFLCAALIHISAQADVRINEFLAYTSSEDDQGDALEWVELINTGPEAIDLAGYSLSDDPLAPRKWIFPALNLPPGGLTLVYATGRGTISAGEFHLNFQLNREGEPLVLYNSLSEEIDRAPVVEHHYDVSYGRSASDPAQWLYFTSPSPNQPNGAGVIGFAAAPVFDPPGGVYRSTLSLSLSAEADARIYYTTDGSEPNTRDNRYTQPIEIAGTSIIRARAYRTDYGSSPIMTNTYVMRGDQTLPIVSVVTEPANLFNARTGIYANPTQYGEAWERPTSVEWIGEDGTRRFGVDCGLRIHGGASRTRSPKKSFRLYFRARYGPARLTYPVLGGERANYDRLVLRAGFNDSWGYDNESQRPTAILISDQTARNLGADMGRPEAKGVFTELYLNGEYWGIYNPSERINDNFMRYYINDDDWDVISDGEAKDGDLQAFTDMTQWVRNHSTATDEEVNELGHFVDVDNLTDYIILNVWLQNYDWPRHNWYAGRERTANAGWMFFSWDVEYSFGSGSQGFRVDQNTMDNANDINYAPGALFNFLCKNAGYRRYFWRRLQDHLEGALAPDHVHARLNELADLIRPAIPGEADKWGKDKRPADWEKAVGWANDFIDQRTPYVLNYVRQRLGAPPVAIESWRLY